MKRLFLSILFISLLLTSCTRDKTQSIKNKFKKSYEQYNGYITEVEMITTIDEKESFYNIKESYYAGEEKYTIEIIEPIETNGVIIQYQGDKILIKHASIDEYISLKTNEGINRSLLIGEIFKNLDNIHKIKEEKLDGESYYIFYVDVKEKNQYTEEIELWLKKKDFKPYMLNILDKDNNSRAIYKYKNFEYIENQ
ncbi:LolA family protein [Paratissierella segnis]|uniref:Lipoprotein n=1 Tax=Paratissierella segnis TaxID=2763679 RepID=A0A926IIF9_9FIRM|nr:hypothetical protein [Paratissierella segnis]MBC8586919.1 hypothetical protein [Paratissierella segnis]